jgi:hypothetical protein
MNSNSRDKFSQLYEESKKREMKTHLIQNQQENENVMLSNIVHTNPKSKEIVEDFIRKIFHKIFYLLAGPDTDTIEGNNLQLENIPERIIQIISPLVIELREQNETLVIDEFYLACKHIYASLPPDQKQFLHEWYSSTFKVKKDYEVLNNFPFKVNHKIIIF